MIGNVDFDFVMISNVGFHFGVIGPSTLTLVQRSFVGQVEWCCLVLVESPVDPLMTWPRPRRQRVRGGERIKKEKKWY